MRRSQLLAILLALSALLASSAALAEQAYLYLATKKHSLGPVGHSVAGVQTSSGEQAFMHQTGDAGGSLRKLIRGGYPTQLQPAYGHPGRKNYETYRMPISTTQANQVLQHIRKQTSTAKGGGYNILRNSCSTVAGAVLRAGGVKPPFWARSPSLLRRWFRHKGAQPVPRQPRQPRRRNAH